MTGQPRTLGVIGTLVWDRIFERDGRSEPVEEWGGIGYALGALSTSIPDGWRLLPILKLGRDLAEEGRRFVRGIPGNELGVFKSKHCVPNNVVNVLLCKNALLFQLVECMHLPCEKVANYFQPAKPIHLCVSVGNALLFHIH